MFSGKKIACISDIHLGVHQDSAVWHEQHLNLARWFRDSLKEQGVQDIIIAGDIFHNRHEVGVSTLHVAKEFFDILSEFNIVAITGNHDCYYRDNSRINSIKIFERDGFVVHDTMHILDYNNVKFVFCPWGIGLEDIPKCNVVVGHFEITNFKMNTHHVCDDGWESLSLLSLCDRVITGHFHLRDERMYDSGKTILYLGSPLELDSSDRDTSKGYTILDTDTLALTFVENKISPKHAKIYISDLQNNKYSASILKSIIPNNYIKLIVDVKFSDSNVDALLVKLNTLKPVQLKVEYDLPLDDNEVSTADSERLVSIESIMKEYIDALDTKAQKQQIYTKCMELYKQFQN